MESIVASIQDVRLEIVENQGRAAITVTYTLLGSIVDVNSKHLYIISIDLVGDDEGAGEDGHSERIADAPLLRTSTRFGPHQPRFDFRHTIPVSSSLLDEDRGVGPGAIFPIADEIRARVTLTPFHSLIVGHSNLVRRGPDPRARRRRSTWLLKDERHRARARE